MDKFSVVLYGLGPIGCAIGRLVLERGFNIVGAVDIDDSKIGKDAGDILGVEKTGINVTKSIYDIHERADIAIVATTSKISSIKNQLFKIFDKKMNVVSTCEELVYPWISSYEDAKEIDEYSRKNNVSVLSTGINPGFLMDFLPAVVSGICKDIEYVKVERIQNAYFRRGPFQRKIGVNLTKEEFQQKVESGLFGHVGLKESIYMMGRALGHDIEAVEEIIEPVTADSAIMLDGLSVNAGRVLGLHQKAIGYINKNRFIVLDFVAAIAQENPHDSIYIKGKPEIRLTIDKGVNGDISTAAVIVNSIKSVVFANAGLKTMIDICPVSFSK